MNKKVVCVYCASSENIKKEYIDSAKELGKIMVEKNLGCIFGAGKIGLMGALSDTLISLKGYTIGVIPKFMIERGWGRNDVSKLVVTQSMHERKEKMMNLSDAAIALPGGCGTMDELMEVITYKQLGLYNKPFIILNINNYYDPLLNMLEKSIKEGFLPIKKERFWKVAKSVEEAIKFLDFDNTKKEIKKEY